MTRQRRFRSRKSSAKKTGARAPAVARTKLGQHQPGAAGRRIGGDSASPWDPLLVGLLIFVSASPALVGPWGQDNGYRPDLHMAAFIQTGVMVILSLFFLSAFGRRRIVIPRSPLLLPLVAFYGFAMLSIYWADARYEAMVDGLEWSAAFAGALLVMLILRDPKLIRAMLLGLLVSGLLISLLVIGQYLLGIDWVMQHIVPGATFANKNMAGQYGLISLPIAMVFFLRADKKHETWFFAVVIALMTTHIFYTHSRGAWLGLVFEFLFFVLLLAYLKFKHGFGSTGKPSGRKLPAAGALLLALGLCYATPSLLKTTEKVERASIGASTRAAQVEHGGEMLRDTVVGLGSSSNIRFTMWANSIPMFKDHFLLGVGLGNWMVHYPRYQSWYRQDSQLANYQYHANAHNDYVEILCELGIIGFALFIWFVVSLFRIAGTLLRRGDKECLFLALPIIIAVSGMALNAVFSFPFKQPVPVFLLAIYAAALSNLYSATTGSGEHILSLPKPPIKAVAVAVTVLLTASVFALHYNWYQSELHYRSSLLAKGEKQYQQLDAEIKEAIALNPLNLHLLRIQAFAIQALGGREADEKNAAILEKVLQSYPYDLVTVFNLEAAYRRLGRAGDAADLLRDMLTVADHRRLRKRYKEVLPVAGRASDAIEQIEEFWLPAFQHRYHRRLADIPPSALQRFEEKFGIGMRGFSMDNDPRVRMSNIRKLAEFCRGEGASVCGDPVGTERLARVQKRLQEVEAEIRQLERRVRQGHAS